LARSALLERIFCSLANFLDREVKYLGFPTFSPVERMAKFSKPKSIPRLEFR